MAVGVQDQRPAVLNQQSVESYLGMQRGGYGNPFDVTTASKRPLTDDMANLIAEALRQSGARAVPVRLPPAASPGHVVGALNAANPDKSLVLRLHEWESDTYSGTEVLYDVDLRVPDPGGTTLASKTAKGTEQLGAGFWDPQSVAQEGAPRISKKTVEALFSGEIADALALAAAQ